MLKLQVNKIKPGQIIIKNNEVLDGLMGHRFDPLLINIISYTAGRYGIVMTESFRKKRHINDLHGTNPVRAVDIREWCYDKGLAIEICNDINQQWIYDPARPNKQVALIHKVNGGVSHFHIQVSPNTINRSI